MFTHCGKLSVKTLFIKRVTSLASVKVRAQCLHVQCCIPALRYTVLLGATSENVFLECSASPAHVRLPSSKKS